MSDNELKESGLVPVSLSGGKRTNIGQSDETYNEMAEYDSTISTFPVATDWWIGWGKDTGCQFEGPWKAMAILAAKILRHPNTKAVAPNLYTPDIPITPEQESHYT